MEGFGPIDPSDDGRPFHADWEARVYALNLALVGRGVYTLDEFRDAVERTPAARYLAAPYYERWLEGVERLLVEKGVIKTGDLDAGPGRG
jgi:hypothetical protein